MPWGAGGAGGAAAGALAVELCAPLLLLCWLCCWPDDRSETSSTGKPPKKPSIISHIQSHGSRRRSHDFFGRRVGSSAASLHLPSTSGSSKQQLSAHRSHEEIPARRRSHSHLDINPDDNRYHSAPSVIDEVIHRRDWERSTKDLYIPLRPDIAVGDSDESPEAPRAEPESSSLEARSEERLAVTCKKHYTNIKSSKHRNKKELTRVDVKDTDATETSSFYIGDNKTDDSTIKKESQSDMSIVMADDKIIMNNDIVTMSDEKIKSVYKAKDAKQTFNESIKTKDRSKEADDPDGDVTRLSGYKAKMFDIDLGLYDEFDRSGAVEHYMESRASLYPCVSTSPFPPQSVVVGWAGGACVVAESGELAARAGVRARMPPPPSPGACARTRHASDGDILAAAPRPESGAFSESDVELELPQKEERPPAYHELHNYDSDRKETAI